MILSFLSRSKGKLFNSVVSQYGHTKIFFRAGILGLMEEIRDDRINDLVSMLQVNPLSELNTSDHQQSFLLRVSSVPTMPGGSTRGCGTTRGACWWLNTPSVVT